MFRSFKAIANRNVFANCKNRVVIRKAKTTEHATLHAPRAHSYELCASLRGLLCSLRGLPRTVHGTGSTSWQTDWSTQSQDSWMSGMQPCCVRRSSPAVVVVV